MLAGVFADTAGVLLALLWTAGFLPSYLDPSSITVTLAKPVPRWSLLVGMYLGVTAFVAARRYPGDPRTIPLARHAQIVLEVGGYVRPHRFFLFGTRG